MNIGIYNLEPQFINIALEKIKLYHLSKGDTIDDYKQLWHDTYDKIYCSSIFSYTDKKDVTKDMECGGTGFKELIHKELPKKIDKMKPKINIGFTSRGCIRKCEFCLVWKKEPALKITGDIYDIWDGISELIILFDNNILALPAHFKNICNQVRENKLRVDFNQGLDIRLLDDKVCRLLKSIKTKEYRFSWDEDYLFPIIKKKIDILKRHKIKGTFYILVGYNSTFEKELDRINYLYSRGQRAYVMRHENCKDDKRYIALSNWCNSPTGFRIMEFYNEYLNTDYAKSRYKKYFNL